MSHKLTWTPELVEELLTLWRQGLSASVIASKIGGTRNAVIGKIHREERKAGVKARKQRPVSVHPTDKPRSKKPMLTLPQRAGSVSRIVSAALPVPDEGQIASIVDVTGCRWPVKDDPAFVGGVGFCNHVQKDGSSYCAYHAHANRASYSRTLISDTIKSAIYMYKRAA